MKIDGTRDNVDKQLSIYPHHPTHSGPLPKNLRICANLVGRPVGGWGFGLPDHPSGPAAQRRPLYATALVVKLLKTDRR